MKNNFNEEEYKKLNDFFENNNEFAVFYPCSGQDLKVMNILNVGVNLAVLFFAMMETMIIFGIYLLKMN